MNVSRAKIHVFASQFIIHRIHIIVLYHITKTLSAIPITYASIQLCSPPAASALGHDASLKFCKSHRSTYLKLSDFPGGMVLKM